MKKCLIMLAVAAMMVACGGDDSKKKAAEMAAAKAKEAVDVKVAIATTETMDVCETYTAELKARVAKVHERTHALVDSYKA